MKLPKPTPEAQEIALQELLSTIKGSWIDPPYNLKAPKIARSVFDANKLIKRENYITVNLAKNFPIPAVLIFL